MSYQLNLQNFVVEMYYWGRLRIALIISLILHIAIMRLRIGDDVQFNVSKKDNKDKYQAKVTIPRTWQKLKSRPPPKKGANKKGLKDVKVVGCTPAELKFPLVVSNDTLQYEKQTSYQLEPQPIGGYWELRQKIRYPENMRWMNIEGRVIVQLHISETGEITEYTCEATNKYFEGAVLSILLKSAWLPARQGTFEVPCWVAVPVNFRLK